MAERNLRQDIGNQLGEFNKTYNNPGDTRFHTYYGKHPSYGICWVRLCLHREGDPSQSLDGGYGPGPYGIDSLWGLKKEIGKILTEGGIKRKKRRTRKSLLEFF